MKKDSSEARVKLMKTKSSGAGATFIKRKAPPSWMLLRLGHNSIILCWRMKVTKKTFSVCRQMSFPPHF